MPTGTWQLNRRQFAAVAALLAVSLAGCRRREPHAQSRTGASRPSRGEQSETRAATRRSRPTGTRRAAASSRAANDSSRGAQAP